MIAALISLAAWVAVIVVFNMHGRRIAGLRAQVGELQRDLDVLRGWMGSQPRSADLPVMPPGRWEH